MPKHDCFCRCKKCFPPIFKDFGSSPHQNDSRSRNQQARTWTKTRMSMDHDSGRVQNDVYIGYVGEKDQKKKVHVAIDMSGEVVFVRDLGTKEVLYDKKHGIGHLPPDLNWSR